MPAEISSELKLAILTLSHLSMAERKILKTLRDKETFASKTTINKVVNAAVDECGGVLKAEKTVKTSGKPCKRTKELLRKVKHAISGK